MRKKLIILGTAESLNRTPWDVEEYDYWACSPVLSYDVVKGKRIDAVFEMHQKTHWNAKNITDILNNFIKLNPESVIYMLEEQPTINNSKAYPLSEIQNSVKHDLLGKYFTSTIAYMVAMAVTLGGYEKIELWGCHMAAEEEEYSRQRSAVESWLNYGLGKGIDYWLTPEAEVMKCGIMYGYEQHQEQNLKILNIKNAIAEGVKHYENEYKIARDNLNQQKGGMETITRLIKELKIK